MNKFFLLIIIFACSGCGVFGGKKEESPKVTTTIDYIDIAERFDQLYTGWECDLQKYHEKINLKRQEQEIEVTCK